jgi:alpha-1,6-mannosyltransferase
VKIVDICAFYAPGGGGVRTYIDQKLAIGPMLGHEIVIVAPGDEDRTEWRNHGARIEWLSSPQFPLDRKYRFFSDASALRRLLNREMPDFVEASSPWRSATAVAEWKREVPRALVMHSDPLAAYAYRWLEHLMSPQTVDRRLDRGWRYLRRLDRSFDLVISASASLTERLTRGGLQNVVTNPMGVEPDVFSPLLRDVALRARLLERCALPANATLLLGVGRHAPEKRWPLVIEGVMAAAFDQPIGLVLVGDGRERDRLIRLINGNPHIHLLAPIHERKALARLMASCDALVHGCEAETFSMVAAEAAASGLPLIVPDRGGAADHALRTGGLRYRSGDPTDAARAIRQFVLCGSTPRSSEVRTMFDHFQALFVHYARLAADIGVAAA